jgi:hypothetical protein
MARLPSPKAIAVAAALAFGLGSRAIAQREVENLLSQMRSGEGPETSEPRME